MDIFTHAVAGAAAGAVFGHPWLGAFAAVLPDLPLIGKRKLKPSPEYDYGHSLIYPAVVFALSFLFQNTPAQISTIVFAILSHLFLDLFTHGPEWAPPLLYPFNRHRFSYGEEWEWFNRSWLQGLLLSFAFVLLCLSLSTLNLR